MFLPLAEDEVFELGHAPCLWVGSHATLRACSITGMKQGVFFCLARVPSRVQPKYQPTRGGRRFLFLGVSKREEIGATKR